jgi:hypothetical protein
MEIMEEPTKEQFYAMDSIEAFMFCSLRNCSECSMQNIGCHEKEITRKQNGCNPYAEGALHMIIEKLRNEGLLE